MITAAALPWISNRRVNNVTTTEEGSRRGPSATVGRRLRGLYFQEHFARANPTFAPFTDFGRLVIGVESDDDEDDDEDEESEESEESEDKESDDDDEDDDEEEESEEDEEDEDEEDEEESEEEESEEEAEEEEEVESVQEGEDVQSAVEEEDVKSVTGEGEERPPRIPPVNYDRSEPAFDRSERYYQHQLQPREEQQNRVRPQQIVVPGFGGGNFYGGAVFCYDAHQLMGKVSPRGGGRGYHRYEHYDEYEFAIGRVVPSPTTRDVEYRIIDLLGEGVFGSVFLCVMRSLARRFPPRQVAMKVSKNNGRSLKNAAFEARALEKLSKKFNVRNNEGKASSGPGDTPSTCTSPSVNHDWYEPEFETPFLQFYDSFMYLGRACIVVERMDMTLYDMIRMSCNPGPGRHGGYWGVRPGLPLEVVADLSEQILKKLALMRLTGVIHCDLKMDNILIRQGREGEPIWKMEAKISDFGCGMSEGDPIHRKVQSRYYRAPEAILGLTPYSCALDVWSLGCMMAEMATREPLFESTDELDQLNKMTRILGPIPHHMVRDAMASGRGGQVLEFFDPVVILDTVYLDTYERVVCQTRYVREGQDNFETPGRVLPWMYYSMNPEETWLSTTRFLPLSENHLRGWAEVQAGLTGQTTEEVYGRPCTMTWRLWDGFRLRFPGERINTRVRLVESGPTVCGVREMVVDTSQMMFSPKGMDRLLRSKCVEGLQQKSSPMEKKWAQATAACFVWDPELRVTPAQLLSAPFYNYPDDVSPKKGEWEEGSEWTRLEGFFKRKESFLVKAAERLSGGRKFNSMAGLQLYADRVARKWASDFRKVRKSVPDDGYVPSSFPGLDFSYLFGIDSEEEDDSWGALDDVGSLERLVCRGTVSCDI
ncbi:hypothetical protein FOL47_009516 [Perkinsus chesapeaki]|uniref:Protein kinase domain-containing protein n=1 Tax=Perkinsus chesapeaki TaxID=330153 RepID=A0A7J6MS68_PERCH|nr:hypothetical protein FOL47_009516 [Perkinsus chesapeaki]